MELSELTAYASEKYQMSEQHKWTDFPGFSVLCHPQTGKWVALLMRQWDGETGREIEHCDLKCGSAVLQQFPRPYLTPPVRMRGSRWIDIVFDERTEREIVFLLLDRAVAEGAVRGAGLGMTDGTGSGYMIFLGSQLTARGESSTGAGADIFGREISTDNGADISGRGSGIGAGNKFSGAQISAGENIYRDTPLPFRENAPQPERESVPERLRQMRHLYVYGRESMEAKAANFRRQAEFMEDYEDDFPWDGEFNGYLPTYHDMTTRQLRGYFTWRTRVRRGEFQPVSVSAVTIYLYELLNGIGVSSPEESLQKLREFEAGYLDAGLGDERMRTTLRRWMMDFAIVRGLPPETAQQAADPELTERDNALAVLRSPAAHTEEEIFGALCRLSGKHPEKSPVLTRDPVRGQRLFAEAWRAASAYTRNGKDLFTLCFGGKASRLWHPLFNVVTDLTRGQEDRDYVMNECRTYRCRHGVWQVEAYEKLAFDRRRLQGFLHETDARLRHYLKTGRYLKEDPANAWVIPYVEMVTEAEQKALAEAARPRITIDLSHLAQIRSDALVTQESLLTDEERMAEREERTEIRSDALVTQESLLTDEERTAEREERTAERTERKAEEAGFGGGQEESVEFTPVQEPESPADPAGGVCEARPAAGERDMAESRMRDLPLDALQIRILRGLLAGEDVSEILRANHRMPTVEADAINEAFYDEIGDNVLVCEDDMLSLVEDYREDLEQLL